MEYELSVVIDVVLYCVGLGWVGLSRVLCCVVWCCATFCKILCWVVLFRLTTHHQNAQIGHETGDILLKVTVLAVSGAGTRRGGVHPLAGPYVNNHTRRVTQL